MYAFASYTKIKMLLFTCSFCDLKTNWKNFNVRLFIQTNSASRINQKSFVVPPFGLMITGPNYCLSIELQNYSLLFTAETFKCCYQNHLAYSLQTQTSMTPSNFTLAFCLQIHFAILHSHK